MKKLVSALLAGVMATSLVACSSSASSSSSTASASSAAATDMKIAMITDYGDITDQSFNQNTYEASKAFAEKNNCKFTYKKPASNADQDRVSSMEEAIEEGYNVIVMPGYAFAPAIVEVAPKYADVKFVALDVSQSDLDTASKTTNWTSKNVYSAVYQEELAGYMAGYAAVKLGYKKLGFLGGMAVPAVIRYGYGYVQGADAAAKELNLTDVTMNYVYGGQFYGDADITARMDTWYGAGVEVVFACGGGIYTSAAEAAVKKNGKVIGVDVDQQATIDGTYGKGVTVTSAMKGLAATVNTVLSGIQNGKWDSDFGGKLVNLGLVGDDPTANYVQLATTTVYNSTFTEADYKALVADMYSGKIKVDNSSDVNKAESFGTVVKVTDEGNIKG
ncbi:MAG: BMP family ABC transporter substrate-binding protein [Solobacterium sp.]|nr:BMP family ABC transporter substrate-binding protein [Solobacterium sp.]MCH4206422.1 BMP family ABC transporter substrate-binding protein [Solobacterium sp.]MCH4227928.1 BMP family ABC transporter substrate-binding protein [Solobacterium sp.]MCH4283347.1 BMP family ABC transporter substrate-binding protein [Solobacterium sp.]